MSQRLYRHSHLPRFRPAVEQPTRLPARALAFAFHRGHLLVQAGPRESREAGKVQVMELRQLEYWVERGSLQPPVRRQFLGWWEEQPVIALELPEGAEAPPGHTMLGLRALYGALGESWFQLAGRAAQIVRWDRDHQFCGRCASATESAPGERARRCTNCGLLAYPRLAPAIIVRVSRGNQLLLARSPHFKPGVFSVLAGFVEPGESLEEAVAREVQEETGLELSGVRYFGSQPWPFPHTLMVGFTAEYAGGELSIDGEEIVEAAWFGRRDLPGLPARLSIARTLIDDFFADSARQGEA